MVEKRDPVAGGTEPRRRNRLVGGIGEHHARLGCARLEQRDGGAAAGPPPGEGDRAVPSHAGFARPQSARHPVHVEALRIDPVQVLHVRELLEGLRPREDDAAARVDRQRAVAVAVGKAPIVRERRRGQLAAQAAAGAGTDRADLRKSIRADVEVVERARVRAPSRRMGELAQPRERLDARLSSSADLFLERSRLRFLGGAELLVQVEVALPQHALRAQVHRQRDEAATVVVGEIAERAQAVLVADPGEKAAADRVPVVRAGPGERQARKAVDADQPSRKRLRPDAHLLRRRADAPPAADLALRQHGNPLDEPRRLHAVRDPDLPENGVRHPRNSLDGVEVEDVRVLVLDQLRDPVVEVADGRSRVGRGGVSVHQIVEERGGAAVGEVGVVGQHDLRPLGRDVAEERREPRVGVLRDARHLRGERELALVEVDLEMRRVDRQPDVPRVVRERGRRAEKGAHQRSAHQEPATRSPPCWMPASHFSSRSVINSGCSSGAMCDPPGTVSISAPGMRSYISWESQYGVNVS